MRRLFLKDTQPGDTLDDVFVISGKQLGATSQGKPYIKATIGDKTCQMMARMWNASRDIFNALPESGFVKVRGRVENYQGNNQFIIEQTWAAKPGSLDINELMPSTTKDVGEMCARVHELCGSIQNRHLAALVQAYLDDESLISRFCKAPAAMSFHHAFLGGLIEHTLNAMEVANCIAQFYPGLNRDIVLAGIFLHDIAKTWELSYDAAFGYTDSGQLVGHIVKSAIWVEERAKQAAETLGEPIPQDLIDVIQHIIISHHGLPEHGAVKLPGTPEALAVHIIENMDAKLMMALSACRGEDVPDGNWTEWNKALGTRLYRPDVAPSDAASNDGDGSTVAAAPAGDDKLTISNPLFETTAKKR